MMNSKTIIMSLSIALKPITSKLKSYHKLCGLNMSSRNYYTAAAILLLVNCFFFQSHTTFYRIVTTKKPEASVPMSGFYHYNNLSE